MRILLSNDDGILAPGLAALREELAKLGAVQVVAPESPQSAAAHGITVGGPVTVRAVHVQDEFFGYAVGGRPADCVKVALMELLPEKPDLVVSGINDGANVGNNVLYSGTVAAAAEGALMGLPAIAVSVRQGVEMNFHRAARIVLPIVRQLLTGGIAGGELININVPDLTLGDPLGVKVVPMATRLTIDKFLRHTGPDGRDYYWLTGGDFQHTDDCCQSDVDALAHRYVSVTPLQFDLTRYKLMARLAELDLKLEDC